MKLIKALIIHSVLWTVALSPFLIRGDIIGYIVMMFFLSLAPFIIYLNIEKRRLHAIPKEV